MRRPVPIFIKIFGKTLKKDFKWFYDINKVKKYINLPYFFLILNTKAINSRDKFFSSICDIFKLIKGTYEVYKQS